MVTPGSRLRVELCMGGCEGLIVILALDGMDPELVELWPLEALKQCEHGRVLTPPEDFKDNKLVTPWIWSSFFTGKRQRDHGAGLREGPPGHVFFSSQGIPTLFDLPRAVALNVPGIHGWVASEQQASLKEAILNPGPLNLSKFEHLTWEHFGVKQERTMAIIKLRPPLLMSHFICTDHFGHLYRGNLEKMRVAYTEADKLVGHVAAALKEEDLLLCVSDHGMILYSREKGHMTEDEIEQCFTHSQTPGIYGMHSPWGFYSVNRDWGLEDPEIYDFYELILREHGKGAMVKKLKGLGYF